MTRHFRAPWPNDPIRYPAEVIERHQARARTLDMLDSDTPFDVMAALRAADPDLQDMARAAADDAVVRLQGMLDWNPKDYTPPDMPKLRQRLLGRGFSHACLWGGRGAGKSHLIAEVIIELASTSKERVVCVREFMNSTSESVRDLLKEKIEASRWASGWTITDTELRHHNGSKITFLGMARNLTAIKSLAGCTILWAEECSDLSEASIEIMVPTVMREGNSRIFWSYNPDQIDTPVDKMFRQGEAPERSIVQSIQCEDNEYFYVGKMSGERRTSYNTHGTEKFQHIWRGGLNVASEKLIYHGWSKGRVDVDGLEPIYGIDWGWVDPFCALEIYIKEPDDPEVEKGILYIAAEVYGSKIPPQQLPDKLDAAMPMARHARITADSSEPKSINDLNAAGFEVVGATKGAGSIRAGIAFLQGYRIVVAPDCVNVQSELSSYMWKTLKDGTITRDPVDADNHAMDTMRYAVEDYEPTLADGGVSYA